jgi:hypothetical protein
MPTCAGPAPPEETAFNIFRSPLGVSIEYAVIEPVGMPAKVEISFAAYKFFPFGLITNEDGLVFPTSKAFLKLSEPVAGSITNK